MFIKTSIACITLLFSVTSVANEKAINSLANEWTSEMVEQFIDSCVKSAVNNNMQHFVDKKSIKKDSDEYKRILANVKQHQTAVCKCTQSSIMKDYRFNEISKMMGNKDYIINIAKSCSKKSLNSKKK